MIPDAPPRIARILLRMFPLGERRADIEDDLMELFDSRTASRGARYARRRYFGDVLSLCRDGRRSEPRLPRHAESRRSSRFTPTEVVQDLTYAARLVRRSPAVVLMAIVGLALAIGVGTSGWLLGPAAVMSCASSCATACAPYYGLAAGVLPQPWAAAS